MHIVPDSKPGNVVILDVDTRLDLPADRVLEAAIGQLSSVVLFGYEHDGTEWFAASDADSRKILWMLEKAKQKLFAATEE